LLWSSLEDWHRVRADPHKRPLAAASPDSLDRAGRRRVLTSLCVTVTVSYGVLYYAFPVLVTEMSADTGWSKTMLTAAFSTAMLVAAVTGVPFGRWLDNRGPRTLMTVGSLLGAPALVAIALAPNPAVFVAAWIVAGVAMGATFYPPAFAAITRWHGEQRVKALTMLTLAAGFASTIFAPLTALLLDRFGWQNAYLVLAAIFAVTTIPGHWWGLRGSWTAGRRLAGDQTGDHSRDHPEAARTARSLPFIALLIAMALGTFAALAVVINLVPMLVERGVDTGTAALILGLGGAGQVAGRLAYPILTRYTGVRTRTVAILAATALTTALLGLLTSILALVVAALIAGMARGLKTLIHATAITDRWGITHYGRLSGLMNAPISVAVALGPWAGAAFASLMGSYSAAFMVLAGFAVLSVVFAAFSVPRVRVG
jgi:MFS family permease